MVRALGRWGLLGAAAFGCGAELPPLPKANSVGVEFEPAAEPSAVSPVVRVQVTSGAANPATIRLFRDELSDYHLGRLRSGKLPSTMLEREVPMLAWANALGVAVRPLSVLDDGLYTLASPELGAIEIFRVDSSSVTLPYYERLWPPEGFAAKSAVYCGESASLEEQELKLDPAGRARLRSGLGAEAILGERCLSLELEEAPPGGMGLVPPRVGDLLLDPTPLLGPAPEAREPLPCGDEEFSLGAGCASVDDQNLWLRAEVPLLWVFSAPAPAVVLGQAGVSARVGGLSPDREVELRGETLELSGERRAFQVTLRTASPRPRVVLNEVLANPKGPEPLMEWIELVNAGSAPAKLEGYRLEDSGGSVTLPAVTLSPGGFALLVKEGFVPDPATDVPPLDGTLIVPLPSLGKNGLSNSGELLRLYDASGNMVSLFPAIKASEAGVSIARSTPEAADVEGSFGRHAPPGASPGGPNTLVEKR